MTMQTETPEVRATQPKRTRGAKYSPTYFRVVLPLVYAGMGVALGTLTGITMAFMTVPAGASVAADDAAAAPSAVAATANSRPSVLPAPVKTAQQTVPVEVTAKIQSSREHSGGHEANPPAATIPGAKTLAKTALSPTIKRIPNRAPATAAEPAANQPGRRLAHPLTPPRRTEVASAPETIRVPMDLDDEQVAASDEAKSAPFVSEGDLTVADYNADTGTIQTSDGRTFVLGTTVRVSSAATWDDYRSSVHYRCDQEGSCMLMRAGAVAPNAKVI
jgi:hypothetical protein